MNWIKTYKEAIQWIVIGMLSIVYVAFLFRPKDTEWPGWIQALGSVIAIAASLRVAQVSFDKAEVRHTQEAVERETRRIVEATEREAEKQKLLQDAIHETERIALQLMLKAHEATKRLKSGLNHTQHVSSPAFTAKGEFNAIAFGLKALNSQYLTTFDKFEQYVNVLGACMALSEHASDWADKGLPSGGPVVLNEQCSTIERSAQRFRELTNIQPVERTHTPLTVCAYRDGDGPIVHVSHTQRP